VSSRKIQVSVECCDVETGEMDITVEDPDSPDAEYACQDMVLHRFQRVLDRLAPQADEGDLAGLSDEVASWARHRARATRPLVDD